MEKGSKKINLKLDGLDEEDREVRLSIFNDKIDLLTKLLSDSERLATNGSVAKSFFIISDLKHSSAFIEAEAFTQDEYLGSIEALDELENILNKINKEEESIGSVKSTFIKKIQDICSGSGDKFSSQTLSIGSSSFNLDIELSNKAQKYLDRKFYCSTEIRGYLGRVNLHERSEFALYSPNNEGSIKCKFNKEKLLDVVKDALGKNVLATGKMAYIGADKYPVEAFVTNIEVIPENYQTPSVDNFLGVAPNISGDSDEVEFIRDIRDEWDRH